MPIMTASLKYVRFNSTKLTENAMTFIAYKILTALDFMHKNHLIHRDIKSDNVLYRLDGEIKLADLGFAAQLTVEALERQTRCGTVAWMAPELLDYKPYTSTIDIYSFGISIIEMCDGNPPFHHMKRDEKIY